MRRKFLHRLAILYRDNCTFNTLVTPTVTSASSNMAPLREIASTDAGFAAGSLIDKVISTSPRQDPLTYLITDQLAFISSDDSLRFLTADLRPDGHVAKAHDNITCLERANDASSNAVATAGRDGLIRFWDKRSRQKALQVESR